jgi:hypothetical protein
MIITQQYFTCPETIRSSKIRINSYINSPNSKLRTMENDDFIVRTNIETNFQSNQSVTQTLTKMGCDCFTSRALGKVRVVVELEQGHITKERIKWVDQTDPNFKAVQQQNAELLLQEITSIVRAQGNGGDGEFKVVVVAKK